MIEVDMSAMNARNRKMKFSVAPERAVFKRSGHSAMLKDEQRWPGGRSEDTPCAFSGCSRHLDLDARRAGLEYGGGDQREALA
jgi:hypothetical protein